MLTAAKISGGVPTHGSFFSGERNYTNKKEEIRPVILLQLLKVLGGFRWVPVVCVENVYVLPGVPWLFRACLGKLGDRFGGEVPETHELYLYCSEGDIAEELRAIAREYPGVAIGSYPRFEQVHRVKVSITGRDHEQVRAALRAVEEAFGKYLADL